MASRSAVIYSSATGFISACWSPKGAVHDRARPAPPAGRAPAAVRGAGEWPPWGERPAPRPMALRSRRDRLRVGAVWLGAAVAALGRSPGGGPEGGDGHTRRLDAVG